jgi:hypothetical protein
VTGREAGHERGFGSTASGVDQGAGTMDGDADPSTVSPPKRSRCLRL